MTFTYVSPSVSDLQAVRFFVGDTDSRDPLLTDEEITFLLTEDSRVLGASSLACDAIAWKMIRRVDYKLGPLTEKNSNITKQYERAAKKFRTLARASGSNGSIIAGAIMIQDKLDNEANTDLVPARMVRDQFAFRRHRTVVRELETLL